MRDPFGTLHGYGYPTFCHACGYEDNNGVYDLPCVECGEYEVEPVEPAEPCICYGDKCYC